MKAVTSSLCCFSGSDRYLAEKMEQCKAVKYPGAWQQNKGFALLVVMIVMLLASFLASQLILDVQTELKIAHNNKSRLRARFLAEAGISIGLFRLLDEPVDEVFGEDDEDFYYAKTYETVLSGGKIGYYVESESGKIDLNSGSLQLLRKFLEHHALEPEQVDVITDSLMDWRDNDDLYRVNGAEKDYYESLPDPYIPKNGNIEDPAEFFLIRGTEVLRDKIDPYEVFTVHNQDNKLNVRSLNPAMLDFVTGGDPAKIEAYYDLLETNKGNLAGSHMRIILGDTYQNFAAAFGTVSPNADQFKSVVATGWAGYVPEGLAAEEEAATLALKFVKEPPEMGRFPGVKIRVLIRTTGNNYKYLFWKESHI